MRGAARPLVVGSSDARSNGAISVPPVSSTPSAGWTMRKPGDPAGRLPRRRHPNCLRRRRHAGCRFRGSSSAWNLYENTSSETSTVHLNDRQPLALIFVAGLLRDGPRRRLGRWFLKGEMLRGGPAAGAGRRTVPRGPEAAASRPVTSWTTGRLFRPDGTRDDRSVPSDGVSRPFFASAPARPARGVSLLPRLHDQERHACREAMQGEIRSTSRSSILPMPRGRAGTRVLMSTEYFESHSIMQQD